MGTHARVGGPVRVSGDGCTDKQRNNGRGARCAGGVQSARVSNADAHNKTRHKHFPIVLGAVAAATTDSGVACATTGCRDGWRRPVD